MCGEVQVPEHHLEVRTVICHVYLNVLTIIHHVQFILLQF